MTNEDHIKELELLKSNLTKNYAIYHERVTLLIQLTHFEIGKESVKFRARTVKPLDKIHAEKNSLYKHIFEKNEFEFSTAYLWGNTENNAALTKNKLGGGYCPFILWLDPEMTHFVMENEDEITRQIAKKILSNKDWRIT